MSAAISSKRFWYTRLLVLLLVWIAAYLILLGIFTRSSARTMIDYIYTSIFLVTLLIPVTINDWFIRPRFLQHQRYMTFVVLTLVNMAVGVAFNDLLFSKLIDYILPGYYFISYYEYVDLLKFFAVAMIASTLIELSLEWYRLQDVATRMAKIEKEKLDAEYKSLTSQVNPHFLFNSLTVIYGLSLKGSPEASTATMKLSDILRYVIYSSPQGTTTLGSEVKLINDYIGLQKYRIHPSTVVDFYSEISHEELPIKPMMILPLVENSFKHGVDSEIRSAFVKIRFSEQEGRVNFSIVNSHASRINEHGGFGLRNLRERLELMYPGQHRLIIEQEKDTYRVDLEIKLSA